MNFFLFFIPFFYHLTESALGKDKEASSDEKNSRSLGDASKQFTEVQTDQHQQVPRSQRKERKERRDSRPASRQSVRSFTRGSK